MATRTKPLAIRMLEQRGIVHEVVAFDPAIRSASLVAERAGKDPAGVLKTLVVEREPPRVKPFLVMAPADRNLDLKLLAAHLGEKKLRMVGQADAERLTGLRVGGISALALLGKGFPAVLDAAAVGRGTVLVSAGQRGFDVRLALSDLLSLTGARVVEASRPPGSEA